MIELLTFLSKSRRGIKGGRCRAHDGITLVDLLVASVVWRWGRRDFRSGVGAAPTDRWRNYKFRDVLETPMISKAGAFGGLYDGM